MIDLIVRNSDKLSLLETLIYKKILLVGNYLPGAMLKCWVWTRSFSGRFLLFVIILRNRSINSRDPF
jgi:hypothetical protein